jgi:hypothetical protein
LNWPECSGALTCNPRVLHSDLVAEILDELVEQIVAIVAGVAEEALVWHRLPIPSRAPICLGFRSRNLRQEKAADNGNSNRERGL